MKGENLVNKNHRKKYIITTERLKLRALDMEDVDNLMEIFSDPVAMQYYPSTKTREETLQWIQYTLDTHTEHEFGMMAVELKDSEMFIGQCGYWVQKIKNKEEIEIGYLILRKHWNKGYATEAAIACRDYAFNSLDLTRVISLIRPVNKPSIRVAEKNGMIVDCEIDYKGYRHLVYSVKPKPF